MVISFNTYWFIGKKLVPVEKHRGPLGRFTHRVEAQVGPTQHLRSLVRRLSCSAEYGMNVPRKKNTCFVEIANIPLPREVSSSVTTGVPLEAPVRIDTPFITRTLAPCRPALYLTLGTHFGIGHVVDG